MNGSLEECQRLLVEKDRCLNEYDAKVNSLKTEVDSLKAAKAEVCFFKYTVFSLSGMFFRFNLSVIAVSRISR